MNTVDGWARVLVERLDAEVRRLVHRDPTTALVESYGMEVRPSDAFQARGDGGWCDGASFAESGFVLYRETGSARDQFTLAHEFAHLMIWDSEDCIDWLADMSESQRVIEELCDAVAARLLIPDDLVDKILEGGAPRAEHVAVLRDQTVASRTACLIALWRRLPCDGLALIIERGSESVFFGARAHGTRPYAWKGDAIPDAHPLRNVDVRAVMESWWPRHDGSRRSFFQSVFDEDGWRYALLAHDDLWNVVDLHLIDLAPEDRGYDGHIKCPCGYKGSTRWWPCAECGESQCPACQECGCERRDRQDPWTPCAICSRSYRQHNLDADGWCTDCIRDYGK